MIKSRCLRDAVAAGLLVLFAAVGVWAEAEDVLSDRDLLRAIRQKDGKVIKPAYTKREAESAKPIVGDVGGEPAAKSAGDELLAMVPAESLFCVWVNHFEYTLSQIDQFLAGISPMPMGVSMMVRMQFAKVLGSPQLNGVNMGGNFAIFATTMPGKSPEPDPVRGPKGKGSNGADPADTFIGILAPVIDYKQFIDGNPNLGQPDAKGISKLTCEGMPAMLATQLGNFALISSENHYDKLLEMQKSSSTGLAGILDSDEVKQATKEPLWAYCDVQLASESFAPLASAQLEQARMMAEAMQDQAEPPTAITDMDFEKLMGQIRSLSLTVNPMPDVLSITNTVSAVPGTEMADMLTADDTQIRELLNAVKAKEPKQMGADQMKAVLALLPQAGKADFVGTYNLMNLFKMATAMAPIPTPQTDITTKSSMAFAIRFGICKIVVDIALPKEHLTEIMGAFQMMQQMQQMPMQGQPLIQQPAQPMREQKLRRRKSN